VAEVSDRGHDVADLRTDPVDLLVGELQQPVQQSQFVHHLERGGVDRVSAEVAQEVGVLLENEDFDAGAGEKQP
jgi:hypothetical protein